MKKKDIARDELPILSIMSIKKFANWLTDIAFWIWNNVFLKKNYDSISGYMPYHMKDPDYLRDPKLVDPFRKKW